MVRNFFLTYFSYFESFSSFVTLFSSFCASSLCVSATPYAWSSLVVVGFNISKLISISSGSKSMSSSLYLIISTTLVRKFTGSLYVDCQYHFLLIRPRIGWIFNFGIKTKIFGHCLISKISKEFNKKNFINKEQRAHPEIYVS